MSATAGVSVIIPTIGSAGAVRGVDRVFAVECLRSLVATIVRPLEVITVTGPSMPDAVAAQLAEIASRAGVAYRRVEIGGPFNFSASINLGAANAAGEHLLLLNDDTEAVTPGWLDTMTAALGPGVGAVGARLLFEDGTLQHAGHTYRTSLEHVAFGRPGDTAGLRGLLARQRPVAGVTAACMLTPAVVFDAVGAMTVDLPGNYNDVDYCMKLRLAGWNVIYEPGAVLYHFESRSRIAGIDAAEVEFVQSRWASRLERDPYTPVVV